jgi:hypothetical protein
MNTRVIPVASAHTEHTGHTAHAEHAVSVALKIPLTRRELLKGTGVITGTLAFSSIFAGLAPSRVWAVELQGLNSHQGEVILAFTRQIYPHPTLDDAVYALVVKDLDAKASKDPAVQQQLASGVQQLDALGGSNWAKRNPTAQARDVESLAGTPFFSTVRSTAVVSLYSNTLAYTHFGYGASEGDAGYLYKGFNSLSWLPDPPASDSGPIPSDS